MGLSVSVASSSIAEIASWVVERGLAGASETDLLDSFCARCREAGIRLSHGLVIIDTLHPTYEGRAFWWDLTQTNENRVVEYGPTNEGDAAAKWHRSSFYHLLQSGDQEFRARISVGDGADFTNLDRLRTEGHTDYLAFVHRFDREGSIGEMDAVYSHWTTTHDDGFRDDELDALRQLIPSLSLAAKCMSLVRVAGTLVEVYATTLHYAPCCTDNTDSFRVMVALPWGTNTDMPQDFAARTPEDSLLWARNKWLLAHAESDEAAQGACVRLTGPNLFV